ncbi:MAG: S41 family peptidase [Bacteroidales bacterium]|nr:S41 family peptidase [Bacteroidales bacterium]
MNAKAYYITGLMLTLIMFPAMQSCRENIFDSDKLLSPVYNFETLWTEFDRHYSFFEYSDINWNEIYDKYRPMVSSNTTSQELFNIMSEMINELEDGHCNLYTPVGESAYTGWYEDAPDNTVLDNSDYFENYENESNVLFSAQVRNEQIGFIEIYTFAASLSEFKVIESVIEKYSDMDAFIIDIRMNGGGSSSNADAISSHFTDKERFVLSTRYRNGPKHSDFSDWVDVQLSPAQNNLFTKPVVVLTNRYCYSSAEWFTLSMRSIPGTKIFGDTTGGGSGNPLQKDLPNGWAFRLSNSQKRMPSGSDFQGVGIAPDSTIIITRNDERKNKDRVLEAAIDYLKFVTQ